MAIAFRDETPAHGQRNCRTILQTAEDTGGILDFHALGIMHVGGDAVDFRESEHPQAEIQRLDAEIHHGAAACGCLAMPPRRAHDAHLLVEPGAAREKYIAELAILCERLERDG